MTCLRMLSFGIGLMFVSGCQTIPQFTDATTEEQVSPRVSDITNEVQCEILSAIDKSGAKTQFPELQNGQYVANINLTLDVTDNQGVDPSLNFISPFHTTGTSIAGAIAGQISLQQHRNFTVNFTLLFDKNSNTSGLKQCAQVAGNTGLRGDLGISDVFLSGLKYELDTPGSDGVYPYKIPAIGVNTLLSQDPLTGSAALMPNFGSTIDFSLIYGINGGPNWTLTHFTGPSPSSGGLFNLMRTNKDTLVLSFARIGTTAPKKDATEADKAEYALAVQLAAKSAQDNTTRMILQRLILP